MTNREKIIKAFECCDYSSGWEQLQCEDCPYIEHNSCMATLYKDVLEALKTLERDKADFSQIESNLKSAWDYEQQLNKQLMGRLDASDRIIDKAIKILIDKIAERR